MAPELNQHSQTYTRVDLDVFTARLDGKAAYEGGWGLDNEALMSAPLSVSQVRALINELRASRRVVEAARSKHLYQYSGTPIDPKGCVICRALAELVQS